MGYTGLSWGSGFILGPIIGGAFAQSRLTWRWAFYINLLLFVVFGPVFLFLLPHHRPQKDMTVAKALKQADWLGSVLELGGTLAGIMVISFGGVVYPWGSGRIIGLFVTADVASGLFLAQQHFAFLTTKAHRIFPMELFKSKSMVLIWFLIVFPGCALVVGPNLAHIFSEPTLEELRICQGPNFLPATLLSIRPRRLPHRRSDSSPSYHYAVCLLCYSWRSHRIEDRVVLSLVPYREPSHHRWFSIDVWVDTLIASCT